MKKIFVSILIFVFIIIFSTPVFSLENESNENITLIPVPTIEYNLPYPGLLPDHPLYFMKKARDRILIFFTRDKLKRANIYLLLSDKNLAMGEALWEKKEYNKSLQTLENGEDYFEDLSVSLLKNQSVNSLPPGFTDKLKLSSEKHEEVINRIKTTTKNEEELKMLNRTLSINHQAIQQISTLK